MSLPFIGEIRYVGFTFAPVGWAACDGQLLPISQNDALFALIGTTYGGDGQQTFALPDLRGRVAVGQGNSIIIGETLGEETHTLSVNELPSHNHSVAVSSARANDPGTNPTLGLFADPIGVRPGRTLYASSTDGTSPSIQPTGGNQPHENRQPFTCLLAIIALEGVFPSPN